MRASGPSSLGVAPGDDRILAAEIMAAHVAAMVGDLLAHQALPARFLAADLVVVDCHEAARNARALLRAYPVCFRVKKGGPSAAPPAVGGAAELAGPDVRVDVDLVQRFTGRLTHLSQYFLEFRLPLAVRRLLVVVQPVGAATQEGRGRSSVALPN